VESAQLTPHTLQLIRTQAPSRPATDIAHGLGWPINRLVKTAATYRIELVNPQPSLALAPSSDDDKLSRLIEALPTRKRMIMEELRRLAPGRWLTAEQLAPRVGAPTPQSVITNMFRLRDNLRTTPYDVEARLGQQGGYRLVRRS
jgi:hypothetical protein